MFIKKISKVNGRDNRKKYEYFHLVETLRTPKGPRQRLILNLGNLDIPRDQWQPLSKKIEDILTGQSSFTQVEKTVERTAHTIAQRIFKKRAQEHKVEKLSSFLPIDPNSISARECRSIGAEYITHTIWNELGLKDFFLKRNISLNMHAIIEAEVIARLIEPASELHTHAWAEKRSSIYELIGDPQLLSLSSYYQASDLIFKAKDELERHLANTEENLFSLSQKYCFFDLTNSYFEGEMAGNTKARYGRSKEKRSDCKIVTLGLIVDEQGFAKCSNLFSGNTNENNTLEPMLKSLEDKITVVPDDKTVVMDAGLAREENLKWLKENNYHYIVVNRGKAPFEITYNDMYLIKDDKTNDTHVEVKRFSHEKETFILVRSKRKQKKEASMRTRIDKLFIERLTYIRSGLINSGKQTKKYSKIVESIGRLKEKYSKVAQYYTVTVVPEKDKKADDFALKAIDLIWEHKEPRHCEKIVSEGTYVLRTDRSDLSDKEIWDLYIMLRNIEYSFLNMKSHLGLRPNFHSKESRCDAHMFISTVAYHISHIIEHRLREHGDYRNWATIRATMKTHQCLTIPFTMKKDNGATESRCIRICSEAEDAHKEIYQKLGLNDEPLTRLIMNYKSAKDDIL